MSTTMKVKGLIFSSSLFVASTVGRAAEKSNSGKAELEPENFDVFRFTGKNWKTWRRVLHGNAASLAAIGLHHRNGALLGSLDSSRAQIVGFLETAGMKKLECLLQEAVAPFASVKREEAGEQILWAMIKARDDFFKNSVPMTPGPGTSTLVGGAGAGGGARKEANFLKPLVDILRPPHEDPPWKKPAERLQSTCSALLPGSVRATTSGGNGYSAQGALAESRSFLEVMWNSAVELLSLPEAAPGDRQGSFALSSHSKFLAPRKKKVVDPETGEERLEKAEPSALWSVFLQKSGAETTDGGEKGKAGPLATGYSNRNYTDAADAAAITSPVVAAAVQPPGGATPFDATPHGIGSATAPGDYYGTHPAVVRETAEDNIAESAFRLKPEVWRNEIRRVLESAADLWNLVSASDKILYAYTGAPKSSSRADVVAALDCMQQMLEAFLPLHTLASIATVASDEAFLGSGATTSSDETSGGLGGLSYVSDVAFMNNARGTSFPPTDAWGRVDRSSEQMTRSRSVAWRNRWMYAGTTATWQLPTARTHAWLTMCRRVGRVQTNLKTVSSVGEDEDTTPATDDASSASSCLVYRQRAIRNADGAAFVRSCGSRWAKKPVCMRTAYAIRAGGRKRCRSSITTVGECANALRQLGFSSVLLNEQTSIEVADSKELIPLGCSFDMRTGRVSLRRSSLGARVSSEATEVLRNFAGTSDNDDLLGRGANRERDPRQHRSFLVMCRIGSRDLTRGPPKYAPRFPLKRQLFRTMRKIAARTLARARRAGTNPRPGLMQLLGLGGRWGMGRDVESDIDMTLSDCPSFDALTTRRDRSGHDSVPRDCDPKRGVCEPCQCCSIVSGDSPGTCERCPNGYTAAPGQCSATGGRCLSESDVDEDFAETNTPYTLYSTRFLYSPYMFTSAGAPQQDADAATGSTPSEDLKWIVKTGVSVSSCRRKCDYVVGCGGFNYWEQEVPIGDAAEMDVEAALGPGRGQNRHGQRRGATAAGTAPTRSSSFLEEGSGSPTADVARQGNRGAAPLPTRKVPQCLLVAEGAPILLPGDAVSLFDTSSGNDKQLTRTSRALVPAGVLSFLKFSFEVEDEMKGDDATTVPRYLTLSGAARNVNTIAPQCTRATQTAAVRCCPEKPGDGGKAPRMAEYLPHTSTSRTPGKSAPAYYKDPSRKGGRKRWWETVEAQCRFLQVQTYEDAKDVCSESGLRLCTAEELQQDATQGTGCWFDNMRVWSGTTCDLPPGAGTTVYSVAGAPAGRHRIPTRAADTTSERHHVRCCSLAGEKVPTVVENYGLLPNNGKSPLTCENFKDRTYKEAEYLCDSLYFATGAESRNRMRLCTRHEAEAGKAEAAEGENAECKFDYQRIWTAVDRAHPAGAAQSLPRPAAAAADNLAKCLPQEAPGVGMQCCKLSEEADEPLPEERARMCPRSIVEDGLLPSRIAGSTAARLLGGASFPGAALRSVALRTAKEVCAHPLMNPGAHAGLSPRFRLCTKAELLLHDEDEAQDRSGVKIRCPRLGETIGRKVMNAIPQLLGQRYDDTSVAETDGDDISTPDSAAEMRLKPWCGLEGCSARFKYPTIDACFEACERDQSSKRKGRRSRGPKRKRWRCLCRSASPEIEPALSPDDTVDTSPKKYPPFRQNTDVSCSVEKLARGDGQDNEVIAYKLRQPCPAVAAEGQGCGPKHMNRVCFSHRGGTSDTSAEDAPAGATGAASKWQTSLLCRDDTCVVPGNIAEVHVRRLQRIKAAVSHPGLTLFDEDRVSKRCRQWLEDQADAKAQLLPLSLQGRYLLGNGKRKPTKPLQTFVEHAGQTWTKLNDGAGRYDGFGECVQACSDLERHCPGIVYDSTQGACFLASKGALIVDSPSSSRSEQQASSGASTSEFTAYEKRTTLPGSGRRRSSSASVNAAAITPGTSDEMNCDIDEEYRHSSPMGSKFGDARTCRLAGFCYDQDASRFALRRAVSPQSCYYGTSAAFLPPLASSGKQADSSTSVKVFLRKPPEDFRRSVGASLALSVVTDLLLFADRGDKVPNLGSQSEQRRYQEAGLLLALLLYGRGILSAPAFLWHEFAVARTAWMARFVTFPNDIGYWNAFRFVTGIVHVRPDARSNANSLRPAQCAAIIREDADQAWQLGLAHAGTGATPHQSAGLMSSTEQRPYAELPRGQAQQHAAAAFLEEAAGPSGVVPVPNSLLEDDFVAERYAVPMAALLSVEPIAHKRIKLSDAFGLSEEDLDDVAMNKNKTQKGGGPHFHVLVDCKCCNGAGGCEDDEREEGEGGSATSTNKAGGGAKTSSTGGSKPSGDTGSSFGTGGDNSGTSGGDGHTKTKVNSMSACCNGDDEDDDKKGASGGGAGTNSTSTKGGSGIRAPAETTSCCGGDGGEEGQSSSTGSKNGAGDNSPSFGGKLVLGSACCNGESGGSSKSGVDPDEDDYDRDDSDIADEDFCGEEQAKKSTTSSCGDSCGGDDAEPATGGGGGKTSDGVFDPSCAGDAGPIQDHRRAAQQKKSSSLLEMAQRISSKTGGNAAAEGQATSDGGRGRGGGRNEDTTGGASGLGTEGATRDHTEEDAAASEVALGAVEEVLAGASDIDDTIYDTYVRGSAGDRDLPCPPDTCAALRGMRDGHLCTVIFRDMADMCGGAEELRTFFKCLIIVDGPRWEDHRDEGAGEAEDAEQEAQTEHAYRKLIMAYLQIPTVEPGMGLRLPLFVDQLPDWEAHTTDWPSQQTRDAGGLLGRSHEHYSTVRRQLFALQRVLANLSTKARDELFRRVKNQHLENNNDWNPVFRMLRQEAVGGPTRYLEHDEEDEDRGKVHDGIPDGSSQSTSLWEIFPNAIQLFLFWDPFDAATNKTASGLTPWTKRDIVLLRKAYEAALARSKIGVLKNPDPVLRGGDSVVICRANGRVDRGELIRFDWQRGTGGTSLGMWQVQARALDDDDTVHVIYPRTVLEGAYMGDAGEVGDQHDTPEDESSEEGEGASPQSKNSVIVDIDSLETHTESQQMYWVPAEKVFYQSDVNACRPGVSTSVWNLAWLGKVTDLGGPYVPATGAGIRFKKSYPGGSHTEQDGVSLEDATRSNDLPQVEGDEPGDSGNNVGPDGALLGSEPLVTSSSSFLQSTNDEQEEYARPEITATV
eukprot:g154.t1